MALLGDSQLLEIPLVQQRLALFRNCVRGSHDDLWY